MDLETKMKKVSGAAASPERPAAPGSRARRPGAEGGRRAPHAPSPRVGEHRCRAAACDPLSPRPKLHGEPFGRAFPAAPGEGVTVTASCVGKLRSGEPGWLGAVALAAPTSSPAAWLPRAL